MNLSLLKQYFVAIGTATILLGACTKSNTDRIATVKIEEKHIVKKENAIPCIKQVNAAALCLLTAVNSKQRESISNLVGSARESEQVCRHVLNELKTTVKNKKFDCEVQQGY